MNTNTPINAVADLGTTPVERLLASAGMDFTRVKRCPVADCPVCARTHLRHAA